MPKINMNAVASGVVATIIALVIVRTLEKQGVL